MIAHLGLAASAAAAQVLTNLDNFAVLVALIFTVGRWRAAGGYAIAQGIILVAAMAVAEGADQAVPSWTGYLGVIPLGLGLKGVWTSFQTPVSDTQDAISGGASLVGTTLLFLGLSMDSFAVMAPLLADTLPMYRVSGLIGASLAVLALGVAAIGLSDGLSDMAGSSAKWLGRLERLGPYAMILVGLYVLLNTATDVAV